MSSNRAGLLTLLIPVGFHVPVSVDISGVVLRDASSLNLLETPLWQVDVAGAKIAAHGGVLQSECCGQGPDLGLVAAANVLDNLNGPVILVITDSGISITRHFLVRLGDGGGDLVGVEVAASLRVDQTEDIAIGNVLERSLRVVLWLVAVGIEPPLVVGIFVVVAGNLLLARAIGVGLDVGVQ